MSSKATGDRKRVDEARRSRPDLADRQNESGHGVRKTYNYWFCRCDDCTEANNIYWVHYTRRRMSHDMVTLTARGIDSNGDVRTTLLTASENSKDLTKLKALVRAWFAEDHPDVTGPVEVEVQHG